MKKFNMRSGNSPKFKMMGSSPAKQEKYDTSLEGADPGAIAAIQNTREQLLQDKINELKNQGPQDEYSAQDRILKGKPTEKDRARQALNAEKMKKSIANAPWSEKTKEAHKWKAKYNMVDNPNYDPSKEEGPDNQKKIQGTETTNLVDFGDGGGKRAPKAISARERKANAKLKREQFMEDGVLDDNEKQQLKNYKQKQNYENALATGKQGLKFNFKDMLLGGISGGITVKPQHEMIANRMEKGVTGREEDKRVKSQKQESKRLRDKRIDEHGNKFQKGVKNVRDWFGNLKK